MSNHQSMYDIPALLASLPVQTRFLAKRSLFKIPIFGWAIALGGFISVDRSDRSRARESFAAAVEQLRLGASTLVFPEGTRSLDGRLSDFERGGFLLALKSGLAIVPVGIHGSLSVRRRGSLVVRPGRIRVRYGRPIEVESFGIRGRAELEGVVRERLADLMDQAAAGD
jgi:1-acyl-sn-glycerol-3-phosphate acyltransferase